MAGGLQEECATEIARWLGGAAALRARLGVVETGGGAGNTLPGPS
ncbi:hypothetical protein ACIG56_22055 [Nocardia fusca]